MNTNLKLSFVIFKGKKMADEVFRPQRPASNDPQIDIPENHPMRQQVNSLPPGVVTGRVPPQFMSAIGGEDNTQSYRQQAASANVGGMQINSELASLINNLKQHSTHYEEVLLPSKGRFYDGTDGPTNGIVNIRPMTGEEEQILATPRFVKKGTAINMIFSKCIRENIKSENLLSQDRTYLLIYLRGISYGTDYEVQVRCPDTDKQFSTTIDLDTLVINRCPDDYTSDNLSGVLPKSGLKFSYRLSKGKDETDLQEYRERKLKAFGDNASDDTLLYRTAQLLNNVETIVSKDELKIVIKNLPIQDVNYLRNLVNDPPFGIQTKVSILSPFSNEEFEIDLPLDSGFFFPRNKKVGT
jgi:hypothetical protein